MKGQITNRGGLRCRRGRARTELGAAPANGTSGGNLPPTGGDTQESPTDMLRVTKRIPHARSWAPAGPGCHTNPGTQRTHTPRRSSAERKGGPSPRERMAETAGGRSDLRSVTSWGRFGRKGAELELRGSTSDSSEEGCAAVSKGADGRPAGHEAADERAEGQRPRARPQRAQRYRSQVGRAGRKPQPGFYDNGGENYSSPRA